MDSDRDFAHVEQAIKKHDNIYSVDQYQDIMAYCVRKSKFTITRMLDKFHYMKDLPQRLNLKNNTVNSEGENVRFRDGVRWIHVEVFGEYKYKNSLDENEPWKLVVLKRLDKNRPSTVTFSTDLRDLLKPVCAKRGIYPKKWKDLQKQMPYIPDIFKEFYRTLKSDSSVGRGLPEVESEDEHPSTLSDLTPESSAPTKNTRKHILKSGTNILHYFITTSSFT